MNGCTDLRERFSALVEGELSGAEAAELHRHLEACADCAELVAIATGLRDATEELRSRAPDDDLVAQVAASPCQRWQQLLFEAFDREVDEAMLSGLLHHLETCADCRRVWNDFALLRQAGSALEPPSELVERITARTRPESGSPVIGLRTATAAAYVLAVLTSVLLGNPMTLARQQAAPAVAQVKEVVKERVDEIADDGRGELRVAIYRAWRWSQDQAAAVASALSDLTNSDDDDHAQEDPDA